MSTNKHTDVVPCGINQGREDAGLIEDCLAILSTESNTVNASCKVKSINHPAH